MISNFQLLPPKTTKSLSYKVGKRIKHYRQKKNYSQEILGALMSVSTKIINNYEAGDYLITLEMLEKFARALGISVAEMVDVNDSSGNKEEEGYFDGVDFFDVEKE